MHVAINAITIQPGGGLTVLVTLIKSLQASEPAWRITVLVGSKDAYQELKQTGYEKSVILFGMRSGGALSYIWQNLLLGRYLKKIKAQVLINFNHYWLNVSCPQIVYHINLRRFNKDFRHFSMVGRLKECIRDYASTLALKYANANIFESNFLLNCARVAFNRPIRNPAVVYVGLSDQTIDNAQNLLITSNNSRKLLSITSAQSHKDNGTLVKLVGELVRRKPNDDWQLLIAGKFNEKARDSLNQIAVKDGVSDRIRWLGFVPKSKFHGLFKDSLCLVSASRLESFAMVALESIANGCPPVVTNSAAMPESIGDAGLLVSPGDVNEFADAVISLCDVNTKRQTLIKRGLCWINQFQATELGKNFAHIIKQCNDHE